MEAQELLQALIEERDFYKRNLSEETYNKMIEM